MYKNNEYFFFFEWMYKMIFNLFKDCGLFLFEEKGRNLFFVNSICYNFFLNDCFVKVDWSLNGN